MNQQEWLFVRTLQDLAACSSTLDEYESMRVALLVRKLLLDRQPLAHLVNQRYREPIVFIVSGENADFEQRRSGAGVLYWMAGDGVDPERSPPGYGTPLELKLSAFLRYEIGVTNGVSITVRDVVCLVANSLGAVHVDSPADAKQNAFNDAIEHWSEFVGIVGSHVPIPLPQSPIGVACVTLRAIGRVVGKACERIRLRILHG